ncbi:MAG: hypothetical protein ACFFCZ_09720 [Promethearchaeota archaeon]
MVLVTETIEKSCIWKILPLGCSKYPDSDYCPPNCPFYKTGKAMIPHNYPNIRIDCIRLERDPEDGTFFCLETGEWGELKCQECSTYERAQSPSEYYYEVE